MIFMRTLFAAFLFLTFSSFIFAQKAEVTIRLNEAFFDAALDAVFLHGGPLEFSIAADASDRRDVKTQSASWVGLNFSTVAYETDASPVECSETIKLKREMNGVRTAVRFREGKIIAPLVFSGNYNPPFIGCVPFAGWAESVIDLEFDQASQRLVARARVLNVSLNGTGGVGGTVIAKLVQSSIDKKINPIELFKLDKLSFALPVKGSNGIQMKATSIRHELQNGAINIVIGYEFVG